MTTFDPVQFVLDYPQFNTLSATYLTNTYNYVARTFFQFVYQFYTDSNQQYYWACIVLAFILTEINSNNANLINAVGRINNAADGDVSTGLDKINGGYGSEFWLTNRYGFMVWAELQQYGVSFYVTA